MGKKGKRTRWRTLTLNGQESDSESSGTVPSFKVSKTYQPKYSKYSYSSQSTPIRKFQYDSKSTRSSSTASEQKIAFNEDEYTKITTPRQDVLFKKGYLNKPKNYHTQTSTGTTCSTANSTSTCTPDHHSAADGAEGTNLEYESQFVFPNVFVDQNGIYYVNTLEPFPFVVYNPPPAYYPTEYQTSKTKRYSTDSAVESASPNNEEVISNSVTNGLDTAISGVPVFKQEHLQTSENTTYFYANGTYQNEIVKEQHAAPVENRRLKKRKRKRASSSQPSHEGPASSEHTDNYESDEVLSQSEVDTDSHQPLKKLTEASPVVENQREDSPLRISDQDHCDISKVNAQESTAPSNEDKMLSDLMTKEQDYEGDSVLQSSQSDAMSNEESVPSKTDEANTYRNEDAQQDSPNYQLKPEAEEFVPRALRHPQHMPLDPALQFVNLPPTYLPIPIISPIGSVPTTPQQPYPPTFFLPPPGLPPPLNFAAPQQDPKAPMDNFVVSNPATPQTHISHVNYVKADAMLEAKTNNESQSESQQGKGGEKVPEGSITVKPQANSIDIGEVVLKLEEAAKEQDVYRPEKNPQKTQNRFHRSPNHTYGDGQKMLYEKTYKNREGPYANQFRMNRENVKRPLSSPNRVNNEYRKERTTFLKQRPGRQQPEIKNQDFSKPQTGLQENGIIVNNSQNIVATDNKNAGDYMTPQNGEDAMKQKLNGYTKSPKPMGKICPRYEKYNKGDGPTTPERTNVRNFTTNRSEDKSIEFSPKKLNHQNQWIPVSNRKKRRNNKNVNENSAELEDSEKEEKESKQEIFEPYDISQLVDVIPPPPAEQRSDRQEENKAEIIKEIQEEVKVDPPGEIINEASLILQKESEIQIAKDLKQNQDQKMVQEEEKTEIQNDHENISKIKNAKNKPQRSKSSKKQNQKTAIKKAVGNHFVNMEENGPVTEANKEIDTSYNSEKQLSAVGKDFSNLIEEMDARTIDEEANEEKDGVEACTNDEHQHIETEVSEINKVEIGSITIIEDGIKAMNEDNENINQIQIEEETVNEDIENSQIQVKEKIVEVEEVAKTDDKDTVEALKEKTEEEIRRQLEAEVFEGIHLSDHLQNDILEINPKPEENDNEIDRVTTEIESINDNDDAFQKTPAKKAKRKKKKNSKTNLSKSPSNSSSKLTIDDPYNFLLEGISLEGPEEKTNEEISDELDAVIQKSMYSSLEEKLKALQAAQDPFFEFFTFGHFFQKRPPPNKSPPIKLTDLASALKFAAFGGTVQQKKIDINLSQIKLPDQEDLSHPTTSQSGFFLENFETTELLKNGSPPSSPKPFQVCTVEYVPLSKDKASDKRKCKNRKIKELVTSEKLEEELVKNKSVTEKTKMEIRNDGEGDSDRKIVEVFGDVERNRSEMIISVENNEKELMNPEKQFEDSKKTVEQVKNIEDEQAKSTEEKTRITREPEESAREVEQKITKAINNEKQECPKNGLGSALSQDGARYPDSLYPITEAVRQWMTKTRETTPDVEILKSPDVIYREFFKDDLDVECTETETESTAGEKPHQNGRSEEEEVTLFSAHDDWSLSPQTSIEEQDLLDCWENDVIIKNCEAVRRRSVAETNDTLKLGSVDEDDIVEEYQSKYGKNEDYLKLRAEIEEQRRRMNFPKHGDLPYRAICCNVM